MIDSRTTLIVASGLYLLLPLLVWLVVRGQRDRSVNWWCLGSLMAGAGIVLIGLRVHLPVWVSFHLANSAMLASFVFWTQSLRIALGRPWPLHRVLLLLVLLSLVYAFLYALASPAHRGLGVRLLLGAESVYTAMLAAGLARQTRSKNAMAIAGSYAVLAAAFSIQVLLSGWGDYNPDPFSAAWDAGLLALMALLTAVVGHFSYAGMVLDGAARLRLQSLQAQAQEEAARRLDLQLVQQERERRLSLVSASLAHELNQPLTVVDAHLQMAQRLLARPDPPNGLMVQLIERLLSSAERTAAILQRIRASTRQETPVCEAVNLHEQVLLANEQLEPLAQELDIEVQIHDPDGMPWCRGDALGLSQVLVNLMRNAMQAMQGLPRRMLSVYTEADAGHVQVRVLDTGLGLSRDMLEEWGQPFRSGHARGLGMGLAISRDIVEQHRGSLQLVNRSEGGAQAILRVPLGEGTTHGT